MLGLAHIWKVCRCTLCRFFSFGGKLSLIIFIALSGGSLKYGGSPSTISITMIPSDQMSTWTQEKHFQNVEQFPKIINIWILMELSSEKCERYLWSIRQPWDELRSHPVRRSNQRLPFLYLLRHLSTEAKVWQFHLWTRKKHLKMM